jgi:hypothetical protein
MLDEWRLHSYLGSRAPNAADSFLRYFRFELDLMGVVAHDRQIAVSGGYLLKESEAVVRIRVRYESMGPGGYSFCANPNILHMLKFGAQQWLDVLPQ